MAGKVTRDFRERFWEKVKKTRGCWIWAANKNKKGYGRFWWRGENMFAHRAAWLIEYINLPKGKYVLHRCDNPSCVRTDHLFLGTLQENIKDREYKKRGAKGEKNGNSKLCESDAKEILHSKDSIDEIAKKFSIDRTQVWNIKKGKQWKYLYEQMKMDC